MGLFDKIRGEFIDIIEWLDDTNDTMVYRFERYDNEIKMGARLTVREGQTALFINEGKIADFFTPGMYTLSTENMPILSTLFGWKHGFSSPFKAEVLFINMRRFTDLKWGTKHPITLRDPEFGAVRIRAFGTYEIKVNDPASFVKEIVGTDGRFSTDEITDQLRNLIIARFSDIIAESKIPVLDMAANYDELGTFITNKIDVAFSSYGLDVTQMLVENISLPEAVEAALDKRASMGVIGDLNQFTQYQAANALEDAANNPGGMAAGGMGMGMGFAMANQMGQAMAPNMNNGGASTPPPIPGTLKLFIAIDGKQTGPYDSNGVKAQIENGALTKESLVWQEGMASWMKAADVSGLAKLFGSVPPPLPG